MMRMARRVLIRPRERMNTTMMKLSLVRAAALTLTTGMAMALGGCAADAQLEDGAAPAVATDDTGAQDYTISLNCRPPLFPGAPANPCKPDLVFGDQMYVIVYAPNNPQNIAPGRYVHFGFTNDSDKPTGPFKVKIKDGYGNVVRTFSYPGLAPHEGAVAIEPAPYACGWSRTAVLDADNEVDEYSESNNSKTYSYACPRIVISGVLNR
jgi:hypothetical protein